MRTMRYGVLAASGLILASCAGAGTVAGKPCPECRFVAGNNANARVAFEQSRWTCHIGGEDGDCTAPMSGGGPGRQAAG